MKDHYPSVFVNADEQLIIRRQNTFKQLKARADKDGKSVDFQDSFNTLIIDGTPVFSLTTGYIDPVHQDLSQIID